MEKKHWRWICASLHFICHLCKENMGGYCKWFMVQTLFTPSWFRNRLDNLGEHYLPTSLFLSSLGGQGVAIILQSPHQCLLLSYTPWWLHLRVDRLWILLRCLQGGWKWGIPVFILSLMGFLTRCLIVLYSVRLYLLPLRWGMIGQTVSLLCQRLIFLGLHLPVFSGQF